MQLGLDRSLERSFDSSLIKPEFDSDFDMKLEQGLDSDFEPEMEAPDQFKCDLAIESIMKLSELQPGFLNAITSDEIDGADFYAALSVSPNDDIWRKFEMSSPEPNLDDCEETVWTPLPAIDPQPSSSPVDSREIRNHDCMWAGLCSSEKHELNGPQKQDHLVLVPSSTPTVKRKVPGPTSARSILLPRVFTPPAATSQPLDIKRPETPLSDNDLDLDLPDFLEEFQHPLLRAHAVTEVTEQVCRDASPPPPVKVVRAMPVQRRIYATETFITGDHCYFQNKPAIKTEIHTDSLGVQTPSDSEEEIDVETVCTSYDVAKKPNSRSSSSGGGNLPTIPSIQDRQQLQLTMATAMKSGGKLSSRSNSPASWDANTENNYESCRRRRPMSRKRSRTPYEETKPCKRKRYGRHKNKAKRRRRYMRSLGSSDSEVDPTERRSLHNNMERKRRIDLRNSFDHLRLLVPDTADNDKAAKVVILGCGAQFCQALCYEEKKLLMEKAALRKQQERLRQELSRLRRSLASGRR